jgi:hypothetical protein
MTIKSITSEAMSRPLKGLKTLFEGLLKRIERWFLERCTQKISSTERMEMIAALVKLEPLTQEESFQILKMLGINTEGLDPKAHVRSMVFCANLMPLSLNEAVEIITAVQQNTEGLFVVCHSSRSFKKLQNFLNNSHHGMN